MSYTYHDGICDAGSELGTNELHTAHQVYYVGNDGDDGNAGTRAAPLLTIAAAVSNSDAGGLVVLLEGYAATITSLITCAQSIHILGEGGTPGSDPSVELTLNHATANMFLASGNGITFENIKFMEAAQAASGHKIRVTGDDFECIDCYFALGEDDSGSSAYLDTGADRGRFTGCYFVSTSTTTQPAGAGLEIVPASTFLTINGCVFDGGTLGLGGLSITTTVTLRGRSNSFLRGATLYSGADAGYIGIGTSTGDAQIQVTW